MELKEPSLTHHICRKNRDKIVIDTAFLDQPAIAFWRSAIGYGDFTIIYAGVSSTA
jgi:hypothetical protein